MPLGFFGLTALRTDRASARDDFHAPAREHLHLRARRPKADDRRRFGIIFLSENFFCEQHDEVAFFVVAESDLADAEERVDGRVDAHHFLHVIARGFGEVRVLSVDLREKLFDADGKRMQLRLLDDDRDGALVLIGLNIKHTLTWLADRVSRDVIAGVNVNFKSGHEFPNGEKQYTRSGKWKV